MEQHFIEQGSAQEFKRCVLNHVTDCRNKMVAFWGTFSSGAHYNVGDVVYNAQNGAMTVMTCDGPTEILSPTETTFAFTGTCTGVWNGDFLQEVSSISSRPYEKRRYRQEVHQWLVDYDAPDTCAPR